MFEVAGGHDLDLLVAAGVHLTSFLVVVHCNNNNNNNDRLTAFDPGQPG